MGKLKQTVEGTDSHAARIFDLSIQALIILALITFSLETLPDLSPGFRSRLRAVEVVTVIIFSAEYLLRLYIADSKLKFVTSFFGVIDLLAILPFYIAPGLDLRSLRGVRMLRLFRIMKLARYSKATQRFHRALLIAREEVILFMCITGIVIYLAAVGIYYFENEAQPEKFASVFHSMWWAICSLTTVGYGDVYPITVGGRVFTFVILITGLGIVAVPAGLVSSALAQAREMEDAESDSINNQEGG